MELRRVDPQALKDNPDNPRRRQSAPEADRQLTASIKAIGIIQPPLVRDVEGELVLVAGHRRARAAIAAGLEEITVIVQPEDAEHRGMASLAENVVRAQLNPVDQWHGIERLEALGWSEEAIATALALPARTVRKLKLLAHLHPPMLERIATGDMPREEELRVIAAADRKDQAAAWKTHKPKKDTTFAWWPIARALERRRMWAKHARFDDATAQALGIVWQDDLFAPADEDTRYTTEVELFLAAQRDWLSCNLPANGVLLEEDENGRAKLPRGAVRVWSKPGKGDRVGYGLDPRTGAIETVAFRITPDRADEARTGCARVEKTPSVRPSISRKGQDMIGEMRTEALRAAIREAPIDDMTLLAMLVTTLGAANVNVVTSNTGPHYGNDARRTAARLLRDGALPTDPETIRAGAREVLAYTLCCRTGLTDSGMVARVAGAAIGADGHLPNMAKGDFLPCLARPKIEAVARAHDIQPAKTAKATREVLTRRFADGRLVLPDAAFAPGKEELAAWQATERRYGEVGHPSINGQAVADGDDEADGADAELADDPPAAEEADDEPYPDLDEEPLPDAA